MFEHFSRYKTDVKRFYNLQQVSRKNKLGKEIKTSCYIKLD